MAATAVGTAVLHTLIPDHWLPFVLVGRARGWSARATAAVAAGSAALHVALSLALGAAALAIGHEAAGRFGESLERSAGVLLIVFGLTYAAWSWRKGGHFHPGGRLLHPPDESPACEGPTGDAGRHRAHGHYHADASWIEHGDRIGAWALAVAVGANPCVVILPVLLAAGSSGVRTVAIVASAYAVTTIVLLTALSVGGVLAARRIPVPGIARHMEAASGLLIALLGVALTWYDVHPGP